MVVAATPRDSKPADGEADQKLVAFLHEQFEKRLVVEGCAPLPEAAVRFCWPIKTGSRLDKRTAN